jgi:hypothetical protein
VGLIAAGKARHVFVLYRPYIGLGDDGAVGDGAAWAKVIVEALRAHHAPWPDAITFRNEAAHPTREYCKQYRAFRAILRGEGFAGHVVLGSFSVGTPDWPEWADVLAGMEGELPDALDLHEYFDLTVDGCLHWYTDRFAEAETRVPGLATWRDLPIYIGEFGSDSLHYQDPQGRRGWSDRGKMSATDYAAQLMEYARIALPKVRYVFVFADGTNPQWQTFFTRGVPELEAAMRATWQQEVPMDASEVARHLLSALGIAQPSADQVRMLAAWVRAEKPPDAPLQWNNPLNTTLRTPGSTGSANSVGVQIYATPEAGVDANVQTMLEPPYAGVVHAIRTGDVAHFPSLVGVSPWGTNGHLIADVLGVPYQAAAPVLVAPTPPPPSSGGPVEFGAMPTDLVELDQGPTTYDCWVRCIQAIFLSHGKSFDVDTVFQAGKGHARPEPSGEPATFGEVKHALATLAGLVGLHIEGPIDLDTPADMDQAVRDGWHVIVGVAEQVLQPGQNFGHYMVFERLDGLVATVYDPDRLWDGDASETYDFVQLHSAVVANWDPIVDAVGVKLAA